MLHEAELERTLTGLSWLSASAQHSCFKVLVFFLPHCFLLSLSLSGFPLSTLSVLFVTYCGVQLVKERERRQALLDDPELAKPVDGGKKKAE